MLARNQIIGSVLGSQLCLIWDHEDILGFSLLGSLSTYMGNRQVQQRARKTETGPSFVGFEGVDVKVWIALNQSLLY